MRKRRAVLPAMVLTAALLAGCSAEPAGAESAGTQAESAASVSSEAQTETVPETGAAGSEARTEADKAQAEEAGQAVQLEELVEILGTDDEETKDLFGGGAENWTEDRSFYIGRIYQITLGEDEASLYTTCDESKKITSLSVKFHGGEEDHQTMTEKWVENLTEFVGQEPEFDGKSSEAGSQNWKWKKDNTFITLYSLGENLSIGMNPAVGELK